MSSVFWDVWPTHMDGAPPKKQDILGPGRTWKATASWGSESSHGTELVACGHAAHDGICWFAVLIPSSFALHWSLPGTDGDTGSDRATAVIP